MRRNIAAVIFVLALAVSASAQTRPSIAFIGSHPFVCVDAYGAKANDGVSDITAFNTARDRLPKNIDGSAASNGAGGKIILGTGTYDLDSPWVLPTGITVEGQGQWSTVIRTTVTGTYTIQVSTVTPGYSDPQQAGRFNMRGIRMLGYGAASTTQTGGLFLKNVCNSEIADCFFNDIATGVVLASESYYNTIRNCAFTTSARGAVGIMGFAADGSSKSGTRITGCSFRPSSIDMRWLINSDISCNNFEQTSAVCYLGQYNVFQNNHMEKWQYAYQGHSCFEIGSYTKFIDNILAIDGSVYGYGSWNNPMLYVVGEGAYVEIPDYLFEYKYTCLLGSDSQDNTIFVKHRMSAYQTAAATSTFRGVGNMIRDDSAYRNAIIYDIGARTCAMRGDAVESSGNFLELGSLNTQVGLASSTETSVNVWRVNAGVTTATLDIPYPYGRSAASDAAYFTKFITPTPPVATASFLGPQITLLGSSTLTISALVFVPAANTDDLYVGLSSGWYAQAFKKGTWQRLVFKRYFNQGVGSESVLPFFVGGNSAAAQSFYIGEVSVVQGDCPGFFPNPTNAVATFSHYEK
jgi:hypothetical protein